MDLIANFKEQARAADVSVIFPESDDQRLVDAARQIASEGWARPILLGTESPGEGIAVLDHKDAGKLETYAASYHQARENVSEKIALRLVKKPLFFAGMAVAAGEADCMVAGAANTTANVIMAASLTIGLAEGISIPSSFFLMDF
ncbi:MAG: phosphate acetyltransferase, partial [Planctomycetes bacterium]|nr:phosphate acetyltransferase [Planctomycetota bacterium]